MVPYNVLNNLHALFVSRVDEILIIGVVGLIAHVNGAEVKGVIAVIVIA